MKDVISREELINKYILTVQVLFNIIVFIIILKYFHFDYYDFKLQKPLLFLYFLIFILLNVCYVSIQNKKYWFDIIAIIFDLIIINILIYKTNLYETRFLYIIPVIIMSIKYRIIFSTSFSLIIGIYNLIFDLFIIDKLSLNYSIETDLILFGIFLILSWLIANFVKVEEEVRSNLSNTYERLLENKVLLEKIVNGLPLCLICIDRKEKIVHINRPALELIKFPEKNPNEFIGKPYKKYFEKLFTNIPYEKSFLLNSLKYGKSFFKEKVVTSNYILDVISLPIYQKNTISHALAILNDITYDELLKEKMAQLEKLNMVGQMAASIAHEIKNPLTTIKGFLELGLKSKDRIGENHYKLLLSEIQRCNTIIQDFLSLARKSARLKEWKNLKEIIENHRPLIEKDALFNEVILSLDLDDVSDLLLDEGEIKQLILNLARNAIEAMPEGGVLTIRLKENSDNICLEVEDQGQGMPEEVLEKIGTPFITTKENGTGLGLTVCYRVAENHGASIDINSKEGLGTCIKVIFPKKDEEV